MGLVRNCTEVVVLVEDVMGIHLVTALELWDLVHTSLVHTVVLHMGCVVLALVEMRLKDVSTPLESWACFVLVARSSVADVQVVEGKVVSVVKAQVAMYTAHDPKQDMLELLVLIVVANMVFDATVVMMQRQARHMGFVSDHCSALRVSMGGIVDEVARFELVGEVQSCCLMSAASLEVKSAPTQSTQLDLTNPKSMEEEQRWNTWPRWG